PPWTALRRIVGSLGVALLSMGVVYVALCAIVYIFGVWGSWGKPHFGWFAYVFGPSLVLIAITLAVVIFIGLIGRTSADWRREWWTRYGSWLAIYGVGFMAASLAAVFGPTWIEKLFNLHTSVRWGAVISWAASTIAGLLAG